jgi:RNA polymerase sigma-70 factor, ECF subfamily
MPESEMTQDLFLYGQTAAVPAQESVRPEARLVERACEGDAVAFEDLYRMFGPLVHGILLSRVPYDDVKDLVQDVFLAAYKNLPELRDKNRVGAWLASIARNQAAEFYRHSRPTEELSEDLRSRNNPNAEAREILDAIRSLPESYRETLVLRLIEGMTGNEIAERTGLKPDSVRVNLYRGMELLRQKLGIGGERK